jgi:hypothetical protein
MVEEAQGSSYGPSEGSSGERSSVDSAPSTAVSDRSFDRSADLMPWDGGPMPGGDDLAAGPLGPDPSQQPAPQQPSQESPWPPGFLGAPPVAPQPGPPWANQQGWAGQPGYDPGQGQQQAPAGVDPGMLNPEVVKAREEAEFQRFNAAYLNARSTIEQQAIDVAYKARIQQLRLESREAALNVREQQHQRQEQARIASDEPLYRNMYAERLSETYKVPKDKLLRHPVTGEEVWDARIMVNNALILSAQAREQRVQARGATDAAYQPTGGQAGGQVDYMRMKDDQFEAHFQDVLAGRRQIGR